jgi:hypothetical protein
MTIIKRRQFVTRIGLGSAALVSAASSAGSPAFGQNAHDHRQADGPLASATVSFGEWPVGSQPLDRMALPTAPAAPNVHLLIPNTATIKAGGSVNYVIAGFHQIGIYAPGTTPTDINPTRMPPTPIPNAPPPVFLIDDPVNRVYRGLNPITQSQDRVEVVHFANPGLYFVMCLVSVHFLDGMFGWVRVLP